MKKISHRQITHPPSDAAIARRRYSTGMKLHTDAIPTVTQHNCTARLSLGFANDAGTTRLIERSHFGPLRIQKALYPEHPSVCHAIVVHPPGGVVGGDQLTLKVHVGTTAAALIATPGAAKWYRANGYVSSQDIHLNAALAASLEWLPQETIFFNGAQVKLATTVELAADATYLGCEILCFGRTASGEQFDHGSIRQHTTIRRDGKLIWFEQGRIDGGDAVMHSPLGLAGATVSATLLACGKNLSAAALTSLREALGAEVGVTQMKSVLVVRYLGTTSEVARRIMLTAWQHLRPAMLQREAITPRIWET